MANMASPIPKSPFSLSSMTKERKQSNIEAMTRKCTMSTRDSSNDRDHESAAKLAPPSLRTRSGVDRHDATEDTEGHMPFFMRKLYDDGVNVHYKNTPEPYFCGHASCSRVNSSTATAQAAITGNDDVSGLPNHRLPSFMKKASDDGVNVRYSNHPELCERGKIGRAAAAAAAYGSAMPSSSPHEGEDITAKERLEREDRESNERATNTLKQSMVEIYKMGKETFEVAREEEMDRFYREAAEGMQKCITEWENEYPGFGQVKSVDVAQVRKRKEESRRLMTEAKREAGWEV